MTGEAIGSLKFMVARERLEVVKHGGLRCTYSGPGGACWLRGGSLAPSGSWLYT